MYKDEDERLTDILLGEATVTLLKSDVEISCASLLRQLQLMSASENEVRRQHACRAAINELRNYSPSENEIAAFDRPDDISHLFSSDGPPDGTKKH